VLAVCLKFTDPTEYIHTQCKKHLKLGFSDTFNSNENTFYMCGTGRVKSEKGKGVCVCN
jgi:hypothetical protein